MVITGIILSNMVQIYVRSSKEPSSNFIFSEHDFYFALSYKHQLSAIPPLTITLSSKVSSIKFL